METERWRIGELARRTGLTVRTLHHYDAVGLLSPSLRTTPGHRLYGRDDVERLQRIVSLRQLGFGLSEIRDVLDRRGLSTLEVVRLQLERVAEQIRLHERLRRKLAALERHLKDGERPSIQELIDTIEGMTMFEKHFTSEQMAELDRRREAAGEARMKEVQQEWPQLIAAVRAAMEAGTDPADPAVRELARRWKTLVAEFTGGNPALAKTVRTAYESEPQAAAQFGLDPAIFEYVGKAWAAESGG